jgi:hypothetical protein
MTSRRTLVRVIALRSFISVVQYVWGTGGWKRCMMLPVVLCVGFCIHWHVEAAARYMCSCGPSGQGLFDVFCIYYVFVFIQASPGQQC